MSKIQNDVLPTGRLLLSEAETAAALGIELEHFQRLARRKNTPIPIVYVGSRRFYRRLDVLRLGGALPEKQER